MGLGEWFRDIKGGGRVVQGYHRTGLANSTQLDMLINSTRTTGTRNSCLDIPNVSLTLNSRNRKIGGFIIVNNRQPYAWYYGRC